jgi:hypothetical protein
MKIRRKTACDRNNTSNLQSCYGPRNSFTKFRLGGQIRGSGETVKSSRPSTPAEQTADG